VNAPEIGMKWRLTLQALPLKGIVVIPYGWLGQMILTHP